MSLLDSGIKQNLFLLILSNLLILTLSAQTGDLPYGFPETARQKTSLLTDWSFWLDDPTDGISSTPPTGVTWEKVAIPHTLELSSTTLEESPDDEYQLSFQRKIGWYKRTLFVEEQGQKVFLEFEGAHQVTKLWVNGKYVGEHSVGGYTPFHFDITDFVRYGKKGNEIVLSVDNRRNVNIPPEGDRYDYIKWSGLYRDVYLVQTAPIHITFPWENTFAGVYITTPTVEKEDATISIRTQVRNETDEPSIIKVTNRIIDREGIVVLKLEKELALLPKQDAVLTQTGGLVGDVKLWSPDNPYLYRVNTAIYQEGKALDMQENPLGIRKLELIEGSGLVLNDKDLELIGFNRHQAMLFLGDAMPNSLHWKDAWQLKQMGINSVRLAHYPHDDAFLEACDQLGLLVYEEPPTWIGIGNEVWLNRLEEATRRMVRNHRNHPSVMMWGAAINHRGPVERLHYACKEEDPGRFTGSNGAPWTGPQQSWVTDVYSPMDYRNAPISDGEFTYLCEHGSSRDGTRYQDFVSRSKGMTNMIGVAAWTAHDYQTFKPKLLINNKHPFSADRVPYPPFFWYQAEMLDEPILRIANQLVSKEGKVVVFTNCQRVELYHNGEFVASHGPDVRVEAPYIDHPNVTFPFDWQEGEIMVKGYIGTQCVATHSRTYPMEAYQLELEIETDGQPFFANGSDIKTANCYLLDKNGERNIFATDAITFEIAGEGELISSENIDANPRTPTFGVATAYIRSTSTVGKIILTAKADGLILARDTIETVPYDPNRIHANACPIYELKQDKIDLAPGMTAVQQEGVGGFEFGKHSADNISSEYLQFGWTAWVGAENAPVSYTSPALGCTYSLESAGEMSWYSGWGQTGNLPYLAIDGVSVEKNEAITLRITGLKEGTYHFKTYHHRREKAIKLATDYQTKWRDASDPDWQETEKFAPSSGNLYTAYPLSKDLILHANGKDPIEIVFQGGPKLGMVLNGFELKEALEMYKAQ